MANDNGSDEEDEEEEEEEDESGLYAYFMISWILQEHFMKGDLLFG